MVLTRWSNYLYGQRRSGFGEIANTLSGIHTKPATAQEIATRVSAAMTVTVDEAQQRVCKWGASCYQTNMLHRKRFWHPSPVPDDTSKSTQKRLVDEASSAIVDSFTKRARRSKCNITSQTHTNNCNCPLEKAGITGGVVIEYEGSDGNATEEYEYDASIYNTNMTSSVEYSANVVVESFSECPICGELFP